VPSIDFPGISEEFLIDCVEVHRKNYQNKKFNSVFYGNINTSSYKNGNSKSDVLMPVLDWFDKYHSSIDGGKFFTICKESDLNLGTHPNTNLVLRNDRRRIWQVLSESTIMLNITKEKYNDNRFIPARIYEAMIFGMIPVSYQFEFLSKTFSFTTSDDLSEIVKYLAECEPDDIFSAYLYFINHYIAYNNSIQIKQLN
jgi:hypothetical protein